MLFDDLHQNPENFAPLMTMGSHNVAHIVPRPTFASDTTDSSTNTRATRQYDIDDIEEDSPWYKKNALSLDGGGIRGYSSLLIMEALMNEIANIEHSLDEVPVGAKMSACPYLSTVAAASDHSADKITESRKYCQLLPCHYFDIIGGTSTGGLIAIMLGRLRMTVLEAKTHFVKLYSRLLSRPRHAYFMHNSRTSRQAILTSSVQQMLSNHPSPGEKPCDFQSDIIRCRTLVFAMKGSQDHPEATTGHMFYSHRGTDTDGRNEKPPDLIADVVRASVTTTSYSNPQNIGGDFFLDAATSLNNPSLAIWSEIHDQHRRHDNPIDVFLSLGCSSADSGDIPLSSQPQIMGIQRSSRKLDERMAHISATADKGMSVLLQTWRSTKYFRLETRSGLGNIRSHDWRPKMSGKATLAKIEKATFDYLKIPCVQAEIRKCARSLVDRRLCRARTPRWQGFAFGIKYRCKYDGNTCHRARADQIFFGPEELLDHFQMYHGESPPHEGNLEKMAELLELCREPRKRQL